MLSNSSKTIQGNQKAQDHRRGGTVYFPGFLAFEDCTEQPIYIPRPKNRLRRLYYSGKKKKHTVKNLYAANQNGQIIHKSKHRQKSRNEA
ncbi:hypothetical protein BH23THE1_BH23THE1_02590 [soil metagenome]